MRRPTRRAGGPPPAHKRCLKLMFSESGEAVYRMGMGAHHEEYLFCPCAARGR